MIQLFGFSSFYSTTPPSQYQPITHKMVFKPTNKDRALSPTNVIELESAPITPLEEPAINLDITLAPPSPVAAC